jgi:hypothetical protein
MVCLHPHCTQPRWIACWCSGVRIPKLADWRASRERFTPKDTPSEVSASFAFSGGSLAHPLPGAATVEYYNTSIAVGFDQRVANCALLVELDVVHD